MRKLTVMVLFAMFVGHVLAAESNSDQVESSSLPSKSMPNRNGIDLDKLIEGVASRNKLKVIVDPRVRATAIMYGIDPNKMSYRDLQAVLAVHGFADVQIDGITHIVPDAAIRTSPTMPLDRDDAKMSDFEIVTKVIGCGKVECTHLLPQLRPLVAQNGHLATFMESNDLLVIDRYANVKRLEALVRRFDKDAIITITKPTDKRAHDAAQ